MYHLLMQSVAGRWESPPLELELNRFLVSTHEAIAAQFRSLSTQALNELLRMPALFCYEKGVEGTARVGRLTKVQRGAQVLTLHWEFDPSVPPIPPEVIESLYSQLDITRQEMHRSHWAVKDVDLLEVLTRAGLRATSNAVPAKADPRVFISYSHDSETHKTWVRELSERLSGDGIAVTLDQWDLSLGAELAHFMERALVNSDFVLMICTEKYAQKANERAGGVGYETTLVSALLSSRAPVANDGQSRVIPVLRQSAQPRIVPQFLMGRLYVDLSSDADASAYETLLRALHGTPKYVRPPIGTNPFASAEVSGTRSAGPAPPASNAPAHDLTRALRSARKQGVAALSARKAHLTLLAGAQPGQRHDELMRVIATHGPYLQILVQAALEGTLTPSQFGEELEEVIHPTDWMTQGVPRLVELPYALGWAAHHLVGAAFLERGHAGLAVQCARESVEISSGVRRSVFDVRALTGWPLYLGDSREAWRSLRLLPEHLPWLASAFADAQEFWVASVAHGLSLSFTEFLARVHAGPPFAELRRDREHSPRTPPYYLIEEAGVQRRAYRMLLRDVQGLRENLGILAQAPTLRAQWDQWIDYQQAWMGIESQLNEVGTAPHTDLISRLLS